MDAAAATDAAEVSADADVCADAGADAEGVVVGSQGVVEEVVVLVGIHQHRLRDEQPDEPSGLREAYHHHHQTAGSRWVHLLSLNVADGASWRW